ncbi:MAG: hypothetical protein LBU83_00975 [Bacteroidales bacterium]|jgi:hypothetical protein|nr:hypothetical protein [Bacteroidales bacterium]
MKTKSVHNSNHQPTFCKIKFKEYFMSKKTMAFLVFLMCSSVTLFAQTKVYQGNSYTVLARIDGYKIYQGNSYTVLARIDGDKIYQSNSYTIFARIDGDKIYQGNSYTVLARIEGIITRTQLAAILLFL